VSYILIAEDDPAIAELLRQALNERRAVETDIVANGALVMDSLVGRRPDLLILDIQLPGLNGLDVFDLIRNDRHWQGVPVLFLTAVPELAHTANAPAGVHEVLAKPFDVDDLLARCDRLMDGRKKGVAA
jgi:DNA-binding response OmpR family regulator